LTYVKQTKWFELIPNVIVTEVEGLCLKKAKRSDEKSGSKKFVKPSPYISTG